MNSHSRSYPNVRKSTPDSQKKSPRINEKDANTYQHIPKFSTSQDTAMGDLVLSIVSDNTAGSLNLRLREMNVGHATTTTTTTTTTK